MKLIIKNIKENYKLVIVVLITGILLGWLLFHASEDLTPTKETTEIYDEQEHEEEATTWTCSMHPQIKQDQPGDCPICGMDLVPLSSMDSEGDDFDPDEVMLTESAAKLADIQTTKVMKGNPEKEIYLQGKVAVDERNMAELTARFGGRIEKLYVNFTGEKVNRGEPLATIYSPELVSAQRELIEALAIKESRPAIYQAARAKLRLWDLTEEQIDQIEQEGEPKLYFDVLSPISGTVMKRQVTLGEYVKLGDPLFRVVDLSMVWVMFDAYEEDLPWIKEGDKMEFNVKSIPGKTYKANIQFIDPFIHPKTRSAKVRVEVSNPEQKLKPEMFANGKLYSQKAANIRQLMIPKSSVLWTGKRSVVYVKVPERENPTFLYREIVLGPLAGDYYVVEDGLSAGEEIATNGVFKIDASAQLEGKKSMMNPSDGSKPAGHGHGNEERTPSDDDHAAHAMETTADASGHAMFEVGGACEMCKDRIEKAARSVDGVSSAEWSIENHILHLSYNSKKVKLGNVHKAIAAVGHDTEKERAPDSVYNNLPDCCLYERLSYDKPVSTVKTTEFFVNGACGMCKDRIEKAALSVKGVQEAAWEQESKMLKLTYKPGLDLLNVHRAIAKVGHDTEKIEAEDSVYNSLPACCLYRDAE